MTECATTSLITRSRAPWIGVGLALVLAWRVALATLAFAAVLTAYATLACNLGERSTDLDLNHAATGTTLRPGPDCDRDQRNAFDRRE